MPNFVIKKGKLFQRSGRGPFRWDHRSAAAVAEEQRRARVAAAIARRDAAREARQRRLDLRRRAYHRQIALYAQLVADGKMSLARATALTELSQRRYSDVV